MLRCPYCGHKGKRAFSFHSGVFVSCPACGLIFRRQSLAKTAPDSYLTDRYEECAVDQMTGGRTTLYEGVLLQIGVPGKKGRLLDIGTGCGFFPLMVARHGWRTEGIEPSARAVSVARSMGVPVYQGTAAGQMKRLGPYDVITFINVLDHANAPWEELKAARMFLKDGGLVWVRCPNGFLHAFLFRVSKLLNISKMAWKYLVFHQYAFTPCFIERMLRDMGFVDVQIKNSMPTQGDPHRLFKSGTLANLIKSSLWRVCEMIYRITHGNVLLGTSLIASARYRRGAEGRKEAERQ